jgi:hypothetical protein
VLIFAENKKDVDAIHEYLLVKVRGRGTWAIPCQGLSDFL